MNHTPVGCPVPVQVIVIHNFHKALARKGCGEGEGAEWAVREGAHSLTYVTKYLCETIFCNRPFWGNNAYLSLTIDKTLY